MELLIKMLTLNLTAAACSVSNTVSVHNEYELPVGKHALREKCKRPECRYQAPEICMGRGHVSSVLVPQILDATTKDTFERICSVLRKTKGCGHQLGWRRDECPNVAFILKTEDGYTSLSCSVNTCKKCCKSTLLRKVAKEIGRKLKLTEIYELIHRLDKLEAGDLGIELGQCACRDFRMVFSISNHCVRM